MIELKIQAANVTELHDTIRDILNESNVVTISKTDEIGDIKTNATTTTPAVNTQQTTTPANAPTGLDSAGIPWDARIHSTKYGQNADGTWKIVRRPKQYDGNPVEWKVFIQDVLNELKAAGTVPNTQAPENPADVFTGGQNQQTTTPANIPAANTQQTTTAAAGCADFPSLMAYITSNKAKIETTVVNDIAMRHLGIPNTDPRYSQGLMLLLGRDDVIPAIFGEVQAIVNG